MTDSGLRPRPSVRPYEPFPTFSEWSSSSFDPGTFDRFARLLSESKASATEEALRAAIDAATKWAAVETGAIEGLYQIERGFTFTVAVSAAAWDNIHLVKDDATVRAIHDAVNGYEFVLDAATKSAPLTEYWIKSLHQTLCASQEFYTVLTDLGSEQRELPKGQYKTDPNSPLNLESNEIHSYASPLETVAEMGRLVSELRSDEFNEAHPVLQAAYSHYAFVAVHPFADGNGRVSRALASVFLYRSPGIPLVIFADQKPGYIDALEAADAGDPSNFIQFISEKTIDAIGLVRAEIKAGSQIPVSDQVAALNKILLGRGGLQHTEVDAIALRLLGLFLEALKTEAQNSGVQPPITIAAGNTSPNNQINMPDGYRVIPGYPNNPYFSIVSAAPATGQIQTQFSVGAARPDNTGADFVIYGVEGSVLDVFLREIYPAETEALRYRAQTVARNEIQNGLSVVATMAENSLREKGYIL